MISDEEESGSSGNEHVGYVQVESDEEQEVERLVTCILCQGSLRYGGLSMLLVHVFLSSHFA